MVNNMASKTQEINALRQAALALGYRIVKIPENVELMAKAFPNRRRPYLVSEHAALCQFFNDGQSIWWISDKMGRTPASIAARLEKAGLLRLVKSGYVRVGGGQESFVTFKEIKERLKIKLAESK